MNKVDEENAVQRLRQEMAEISYLELQKFFAKGVILVIDQELDLIQVATAIHHDATETISRWVEEGNLIRATDDHASGWLATGACFTAVTVAPWVLVQEIHNC